MCDWNIVRSVWIIYKIFDIKFPVFSFPVAFIAGLTMGIVIFVFALWTVRNSVRYMYISMI